MCFSIMNNMISISSIYYHQLKLNFLYKNFQIIKFIFNIQLELIVPLIHHCSKIRRHF